MTAFQSRPVAPMAIDQMLVAADSQPALPILKAKIERAVAYAKAARSGATRRTYDSAWAIFTT